MSPWRTRTRTNRNSAARIITAIGAIFAGIEVLYLIMVLVGANATNEIFLFLQSLAVPLALFFPGLFPVADPTVAVILDYGLAAAFWVIVANLIARIASR
ncbi:MAG: hypothetical protein M3443_15485 [Actinomycetota bacterium]|nr:hypothetical protein [Actinomycetota bacterium]